MSYELCVWECADRCVEANLLFHDIFTEYSTWVKCVEKCIEFCTKEHRCVNRDKPVDESS